MASYENNSDDNECFQDAVEDIESSFSMNFHDTLEEMRLAFNLFLNNHFDQAKERMHKNADKDMYHALGYAVILYMQAAMTFESTDIEIAADAVKSALKVIKKKRKRKGIIESVSEMISAHEYNSFTIEEVHAELCYAELLCFKAMLTIIQDESLMAFVKAGLKIRSSYNTYKQCYEIIEKRYFDSDRKLCKMDFESGVRFGIGIFNLMISLMPPKILKLLEFVGFSGDEQKGLNELIFGAKMDNALRSPICALALLAYHTMICYFIGSDEGDLVISKQMLQTYGEKYKQGVFFLFFSARLKEVSGSIDDAINSFEECENCQDELIQFKHICYWELMWCHSFKGQWTISMKYAEILSEQSKWSKVMYLYQKAAFLLMLEESDSLKKHVSEVLENVPKFKQKIAGKSLPMEKFAIEKCARYFSQNNRLIVPGYELQYLWNHFNIMSKSDGLLQPILVDLEEKLSKISSIESNEKIRKYPFYADDYCLLLLLKGACLRVLKKNEEALVIFDQLLKKEKEIKKDSYIVPFAHLETALAHYDMKDYKKALKLLELAKQKKGFPLENRLHFRCHSMKKKVHDLMEKESTLQKPKDSCHNHFYEFETDCSDIVRL